MVDSGAQGLLNPLDVDALRVQFSSARFFPFVAIDGFLREDFARAVAESFPTPRQAITKGRTFEAVNERGKTQITNPAHFAAPVRALSELLSSSEWLATLSKITGIPGLIADEKLVGGGMHVMQSGAHLDVHVDFNRIAESGLFRRLNILVFFNDGWAPEWGGEIELWNERVRELGSKFEPVLNRCVLFQTSETSFHGVSRVACPPDRFRKSFAAYYYTREAPAGWDGSTHTTIFRARPDEHWKKYVGMPAERIARRTRRELERVKRWAGRALKPRA